MPALVLSNLLGNYFWLGTFVLHLIAWVVQLGGLGGVQSFLNKSIAALPAASVKAGAAQVFSFSWYILFLQLFVLIAVLVAILSTSVTSFKASLFNYRLALLGVITMTLTLLTFIIGSTLPSVPSSSATTSANLEFVQSLNAYLAGSIMSAILWFMWLIVVGSDAESLVARFVYQKLSAGNSPATATALTSYTVNPPNGQSSSKSSEVPVSSTAPPAFTPLDESRHASKTGDITDNQSKGEQMLHAFALYSYVANPEDPDEVSFNKGERFDVLDNSGKWWRIRKQDGKIGSVPSNYCELLP
eukprot:Partr_v1_DN28638_c0_g1_i2_m49764 putative Plasma membrane osmosensor that activates the high osmolarity glycerol (HOG) MAPK signaling pathway in response to high osmolarity (By similarity)